MNKKKHLIIAILSFIGFGMKTPLSNDVIGTYSKKFEVHDAHSILVLFKDYRFNYSSGIGGCQSEIKGGWKIKNKNQLVFRIDSIYTDEYLNKIVTESIKEAEGIFKINQDTSLYKINLDIAKMSPCFPEIKEARVYKKRKSIIFKSDVNCTCVSIKGKHMKVK
jgi:hypothetical protein